MSTNKETNKNHTTAVPPNDDVLGRTHNSQHPEAEKTGAQEDISAVDQQEGNMKHGETGGADFGPQEQSPSA